MIKDQKQKLADLANCLAGVTSNLENQLSFTEMHSVDFAESCQPKNQPTNWYEWKQPVCEVTGGTGYDRMEISGVV